MTLLYIDGFDHYATAQLSRRFTLISGSPTIDSTTKRTGYSSLRTTGSSVEILGRVIPASVTTIVGFGFLYTACSSAEGIVSFASVSGGFAQQCALIGDYGAFWLARRTSTLGGWYDQSRFTALSSAFYVPGNVWVFIEVKITVDNAAGAIEVRMNGNTVLSVAGVDTQFTAVAGTEEVVFGSVSSSSNFYYDDLYICDNNGAVNNDFLGDRKVETLLASGAGTYAEWSPSAGSNYQNVDEQNCDDDTTYNSQDNTGLPETDSFAMGNLAAAAGNVAGVQTVLESRNDDAGPSTLAPFFRIGGSDYARTTFNPGAAYAVNLEVEETNPDTGVAWTVGDVNGAEYGYQRSA